MIKTTSQKKTPELPLWGFRFCEHVAILRFAYWHYTSYPFDLSIMRIGGDTTLTDCNVSVLFFVKKGKRNLLIIIRPVDRGEGILH